VETTFRTNIMLNFLGWISFMRVDRFDQDVS